MEFDGWACRRIGTVVYSVTVDEQGEPVRGPHAICDHCGQVSARVGWAWDDESAWVDPAVIEAHTCPPSSDPLPANSVCAASPCAACYLAATS